MLDSIIHLDWSIIIAINNANTPFFDEFFWWISKSITWIPLYLFVLYQFYKNLPIKHFVAMIGVILVTVSLCDASTSYLFKETIQRLRPSHTPGLMEYLHFYVKPDGTTYTGGEYGFFSSHAANTSLLATFFFLSFPGQRHRTLAPLAIWTLLIAYSRVYLGVHFLSDVLVGILYGWIFGFIAHKVLSYLKTKITLR